MSLLRDNVTGGIYVFLPLHQWVFVTDIGHHQDHLPSLHYSARRLGLPVVPDVWGYLWSHSALVAKWISVPFPVFAKWWSSVCCVLRCCFKHILWGSMPLVTNTRSSVVVTCPLSTLWTSPLGWLVNSGLVNHYKIWETLSLSTPRRADVSLLSPRQNSCQTCLSLSRQLPATAILEILWKYWSCLFQNLSNIEICV